MRVYKVYRHPVRDYRAVKLGFSWPAFFFDYLWALFKGLWGRFLLLLGLDLLLVVGVMWIAGGAGDGAVVLVIVGELIIAFWRGSRGNTWRGTALIHRGFVPVGNVRAGSANLAVAEVGHEGPSDQFVSSNQTLRPEVTASQHVKKGRAGPAFGLVLVGAVGVGGYYLYMKNQPTYTRNQPQAPCECKDYVYDNFWEKYKFKSTWMTCSASACKSGTPFPCCLE